MTLAGAYSILVIYILYSVDYWNHSMVKDSISWFLMTGLVILFNFNNAGKNKNYFTDIVKDSLKFTLILEFVINAYNFSLSGEFLFIPAIALISFLLGITITNPKYRLVDNFFKIILAFFGLALLILSMVQIVTQIQVYLNYYSFRLFLLPVILSISFIPFIYLFAVYMNYGILFARLKFIISDYKLLNYTRIRSILKCDLRLKKIKLLISLIMKELNSGVTKNEIKNIIK